MQALCVAVFWYLPAGQLMQALWVAAFWYLPAGQLVQPAAFREMEMPENTVCIHVLVIGLLVKTNVSAPFASAVASPTCSLTGSLGTVVTGAPPLSVQDDAGEKEL